MQHVEQHFSGSDTVHDVVIGMTDGLPVPFALAASKREDQSWFIEVRRNRPFDSETDCVWTSGGQPRFRHSISARLVKQRFGGP